ncbi:hypothetical protein N7448_011405 [Penicillium atrosanguineum]|nr:hypothetical protein N7448_011405 [Penicillium atrosanguineum]
MDTGDGGADKMVKKIEERDKVRQACGKWYWMALNFLPPTMVMAGFILFPPVLQLQQIETHHSQKIDAGLGVAFALVASGFVPIFLLPFSALRPRISTLGNKYGVPCERQEID